jgi:hypothetical protein
MTVYGQAGLIEAFFGANLELSGILGFSLFAERATAFPRLLAPWMDGAKGGTPTEIRNL